MKKLFSSVLLVMAPAIAMAAGLDCSATLLTPPDKLICGDSILRKMNDDIAQRYQALQARKPLDGKNIDAFIQSHYPGPKTMVACGENAICTQASLMSVQQMLAGEHAFANQYPLPATPLAVIPAQSLKPYLVNNKLFDPRKHRPQTTAVVLRGTLEINPALDKHSVQLAMGGGYYSLLGLAEWLPADAAARLQTLVAAKATVLVKGMLIQNDASSLALDMYAPVSIYAAN